MRPVQQNDVRIWFQSDEQGRQRIYRFEPKPLREVISWVDEFVAFWNARLECSRQALGPETWAEEDLELSGV